MTLLKRKKLKRLADSRMKLHTSPSGGASSLSVRTRTNLLIGTLLTTALVGIAIHSSPSIMPPLCISFPFTLALCVIFTLFVRNTQPEIFNAPGRIFFVGLLLCFIALCAKVVLHLSQVSYLILLPMPLSSMLIALVISPTIALFFVLAATLFILHLGFLLGILTPDLLQISIALVISSTIAAFTLEPIRTRTRLMKLGFVIGIVHLTLMISFEVASRGGIIQVQHLKDMATTPLLGFANGVATAFIMTGILPFVEKVFPVMTDLSLLEWSDHNQPLLKRLVLEAPGTYHHSMVLGNLCEAAAEAIGANALLARVGAYYHDIGKLNKPEYFVENESSITGSRHANLSPHMSTLIITSHTKDGEELARYYDLPKTLVRFIREHHGTSVVEYFYHQALEKGKSSGTSEISKDSFRYPGPLPQSKESAILMLADAVEATARTVDDPTPGKLEGLVNDIIMSRLTDGQLDNSNLTMREIEIIKQNFVRVLAGIWHRRIKYPGQKDTGR